MKRSVATMSEHTPHTIERRGDVAVIGGSAAGLAAALQLGRQRRSVIVIDAGEPRNAPAAAMHSYLGREGISPAEFATITREEVRSYGVEVLDGRAIGLTRLDDGDFRVELVGGHAVVARRVLAATGMVDELPDIEGLTEHWGRDVLHCPFCHGYEVRDDRLVQIVTDPMGLHPSPLLRQLSDQLTVVLHDNVGLDHPEVEALERAGIRIVAEPVRRIVADDNGGLRSVELQSGDLIETDAVLIGTRFRPRADLVTPLGVEVVDHETGLGQVIDTDATGQTAVTGLFAAGNVTDPMHQVLHAAADGNRVGAMIAVDLAKADLEASSRTTANQAEWDHRYRGGQVWSGQPNGTLIDEITGLVPGRALDIGAGEGGDAVWLAEHGWQVTAADISQRAVDQLTSVAIEHDLTIEAVRVDANDHRPFSQQFDLVTAHYASIPRTNDGRGVDNLLAAVAPGGTLLVVGHDTAPMREPVDPTTSSRAFDGDAFIRTTDIAASIATRSGWRIEVDEKRPRPPGHTAASHHHDDIVLRARRLDGQAAIDRSAA